MLCESFHEGKTKSTATSPTIFGRSELEAAISLEKEGEIRLQRLEQCLRLALDRIEDTKHAIELDLLAVEYQKHKAESSTSNMVPLLVGAPFCGLFICVLLADVSSYHGYIWILCSLGCILSYFHLLFQPRIGLEVTASLQHLKLLVFEVERRIARCEYVRNEKLETSSEYKHMVEEMRDFWEEERMKMESIELKHIREYHNLRPKSNRTSWLHRSQGLRQLLSFRESSPSPSRDVTRRLSIDDPPMDFLYPVMEAPSVIVELDPNQVPVQWKKYVQLVLPLERMGHMTEEEKVFSQQVRESTRGIWDELPFDVKLMALRAWEDRPSRLSLTSEQVLYIAGLRRVAFGSLDFVLMKEFFHAWRSRFAGEDVFGHPIVFDLVKDFDLNFLFSLTDQQVLYFHAVQLEVLRKMKLLISKRRGHRVCKHVYILDLNGLSLHKHFTFRMRNMLTNLFKVEGTAFPDSLWTLWLINTPAAFKFVWATLSPTLDASTKAKIRIVGDGFEEMAQSGIPLSALPKELGGEFESIPFWTMREKFENESC